MFGGRNGEALPGDEPRVFIELFKLLQREHCTFITYKYLIKKSRGIPPEWLRNENNITSTKSTTVTHHSTTMSQVMINKGFLQILEKLKNSRDQVDLKAEVEQG